MQIFIYCKATLHVSGVTAPIIRSIKNRTCSLWYRSYYLHRYSPQRGLIGTQSQSDHVDLLQTTFIYCKATLHVSGVTAPIIRSIKNRTRSLRYRSYYLYRYSPQRGLIGTASAYCCICWIFIHIELRCTEPQA